LDALDLFKFASSQMQDPDETKRGAYISEALDYRVIHPKGFKARENLSSNL
jgi:hypothetical protein